MIYFDASVCGLGNNGGTRTILKCSEVLNRLGFESRVFARLNNFTWFRSNHIVTKVPSAAEAAISVSCREVNNVLKSNCLKKYWYVRGHENWVMTDKQLGDLYRNKGLGIIANSNGLAKRIKELGGDRHVDVVYQGLDFDWWQDRNERSDKKIGIGVLYSSKPSKRFSDFVNIKKSLKKDRFAFYGFGAEKLHGSHDGVFDEYLQNPSKEEICRLYNRCHIWFAPTECEGLHNPPMEAAMCGCLVICNNNPLNGMSMDYAFPSTAMIYSDLNEALEMIQNPNFSLIPNMKKLIEEKIGGREKNMSRFSELLEIKK